MKAGNKILGRWLAVMAFLLLPLLAAYAQMPAPSRAFCPVPPVDSTLVRGEAARNNLWPGFGTGSRRQADMSSATAFRTADILGVSLTGVGAVGLAATTLQRSLGGRASTFSHQTAAPYVIFGGVAAAGIATLTVSRVLAVRKARQYDLHLFPTPVPGGAGLALSVSLP